MDDDEDVFRSSSHVDMLNESGLRKVRRGSFRWSVAALGMFGFSDAVSRPSLFELLPPKIKDELSVCCAFSCRGCRCCGGRVAVELATCAALGSVCIVLGKCRRPMRLSWIAALTRSLASCRSTSCWLGVVTAMDEDGRGACGSGEGDWGVGGGTLRDCRDDRRGG